MYVHIVADLLTLVLFTSHTRNSASLFTSNIHRRRQIDPRLAFHMESLTFCMEVDSRRLLRRTPWQHLLLWHCALVKVPRYLVSPSIWIRAANFFPFLDTPLKPVLLSYLVIFLFLILEISSFGTRTRHPRWRTRCVWHPARGRSWYFTGDGTRH